ncbi:hypothetical protein C8Q77DRAFT_336950 [Trametes polyzona]|nr:hypothetical protein C8Q77DRAFT_336950 [Trametes polyzona]
MCRGIAMRTVGSICEPLFIDNSLRAVPHTVRESFQCSRRRLMSYDTMPMPASMIPVPQHTLPVLQLALGYSSKRSTAVPPNSAVAAYTPSCSSTLETEFLRSPCAHRTVLLRPICALWQPCETLTLLYDSFRGDSDRTSPLSSPCVQVGSTMVYCPISRIYRR